MQEHLQKVLCIAVVTLVAGKLYFFAKDRIEKFKNWLENKDTE